MPDSSQISSQMMRQEDLVDTIERARQSIMTAMSLMTGYVDDSGKEGSLEHAYDLMSSANATLWKLGNDVRDCELGVNGHVISECDGRIGITARDRFSIDEQRFVRMADDPSIHVLYAGSD